MLNSAEWSMKKVFNFWYFYFYDRVKFHAQLSWAWKNFYNLGLCIHTGELENPSRYEQIYVAGTVSGPEVIKLFSCSS